MQIQATLNDVIAPHHLLKHPFYQAWMKGELTMSGLQRYAEQYFPHVRAFPRFVSTIHSQAVSDQARKILFANLSEEEGMGHSEDHPELWLRFAEGLGCTREQVQSASIGPRAQALVDTYFDLCRSSYAEGLGALIAYESQVPEVADAKIDGLKQFYGISDDRTTAFFAVHREADRFHSESCARLLQDLSDADRKLAIHAAERASIALWDFLTEVHGSDHCAAA